VSDVKVEQKQTLSREEAARFIAVLANGMSDGGNVTVRLGSSTLQLSVAAQVDCELEVSVDGDEIELELELKWSTSGTASAEAAEDESQTDEDEASEDEASEDEADEDGADEAPEDESGGDEGEPDEAGPVVLEAEPEGHDSGEGASKPDPSAEGAAGDGEQDFHSAGPTQAESPRMVPANRTPRPRRSRPSAPAETGQPASDGVDTAAVRAWAAAKGLSVSPRGRIKAEVLQAYRDAGN
jgi:amphi-Trp domain-containing protein